MAAPRRSPSARGRAKLVEVEVGDGGAARIPSPPVPLGRSARRCAFVTGFCYGSVGMVETNKERETRIRTHPKRPDGRTSSLYHYRSRYEHL